jgi:hypothetical protein
MSVPPVMPPPHAGSPGLDIVGPRHPNDAAPGRITKGGSLLTGGYLGHKIYVGNLPERSIFPFPSTPTGQVSTRSALLTLVLFHSATLADLEDCFGQIGPCACVLKRGFGFVVRLSFAVFPSLPARRRASSLLLSKQPRNRPSDEAGLGVLTVENAGKKNDVLTLLSRSQEYEQPGHAAEAVAKYNEGHFLGSQIKVELSLARAPIGKNDGPGVLTSYSRLRIELTLPDPQNGNAGALPPHLRGPNPPGSDRPSDPRKPMWINGSVTSPLPTSSTSADSSSNRTLYRSSSAPGGAPPRARSGPPPGYGGGGGGYGGPPGYGGGGGGYGGPRYDERPPFDRPGYGPPPRGGEFDRYGPPPPRGGAPAPYGAPPVDRPPYDPYYDRSAPRPDYPPFPPAGAAPGYPPVAPYDRPPYGAGAPGAPPPPPGSIPPYGADRGYPPPGSVGRSPVMPPPDAIGSRPPYGAPPPLDPYSRSGPPLDNGAPLPPSGYDPRDERGAGSRYQPYPSREERGRGGNSSYGGRSPNRFVSISPLHSHVVDSLTSLSHSGGPPPERRRSLSPRRGGNDNGYGSNGYAPYDSRGPSNGNGYGRSPPPPRYPPTDEYNPRR